VLGGMPQSAGAGGRSAFHPGGGTAYRMLDRRTAFQPAHDRLPHRNPSRSQPPDGLCRPRRRTAPNGESRYPLSCGNALRKQHNRDQAGRLRARRGRHARRRRSGIRRTVYILDGRRYDGQHECAGGQRTAGGRTGQLGLRNRPGALARIPFDASFTPLSPIPARTLGTRTPFAIPSPMPTHIPVLVGSDSQNWCQEFSNAPPIAVLKGGPNSVDMRAFH
jgi:hypothetical protein